MPASSTKKRPPMEMEPGEGKAHEMKESPEEEVREGSEPDDMPKAKGKTNRKRSAKGAKQTKAPMDGGMYGKKPMDGEGCGCGGKRKAKCDGSCGKKMDRNDALTPQEYLAACDLGIQGRSRSYIRARLDAAERLDLKCGKGSISPGEKCTKGTAQKVDPKAAAKSAASPSGSKKVSTGQRVLRGVTSGMALYSALANAENAARLLSQGNVEGALTAGGGAVGSLTAMRSYSRGQYLQGMGREAAGIAGGIGAAAGYGAVRGFQRAGGPQKVREAWKKAKYRAGSVNVKATRVSEGPALLRGRRDSVYAEGFTPELEQLAI